MSDDAVVAAIYVGGGIAHRFHTTLACTFDFGIG